MTILSSMDCGNWTQDSIDYKPSGQPREENTGKWAYNADINKTRDYLTDHINFGYDNTDSLWNFEHELQVGASHCLGKAMRVRMRTNSFKNDSVAYILSIFLFTHCTSQLEKHIVRVRNKKHITQNILLRQPFSKLHIWWLSRQNIRLPFPENFLWQLRESLKKCTNLLFWHIFTTHVGTKAEVYDTVIGFIKEFLYVLWTYYRDCLMCDECQNL